MQTTTKWAKALGWFSLGLGVAELLTAARMGRALGIKNPNLIRAYGIREIGAGLGVLTAARKGPWIWARILGDALDGATLGAAALSKDRRHRRNALLALAAVSPVVAADIVCGQQLGLRA